VHHHPHLSPIEAAVKSIAQALEAADQRLAPLVEADPLAWLAVLHRAVQLKKALLGDARIAFAAAGRAKRRAFLYELLRRPMVRAAALYEQLLDDGLPVEPEEDWSPRRVVDTAYGADFWHPLYGDIVGSFEPKASGENRAIFMLDNVVDRARHRLALEAHRALLAAHPRQFAAAGGFDAFKSFVRAHLPAAKWAVTTDIPDFFHVVHHAAVEKGLLLPRQVTQASLTQPFGGDASPVGVTGDSVEATLQTKPRHTSRGSPLWVLPSMWRRQSWPCAQAADGFGVLPGLPLSAVAAEVVLGPVIDRLERAMEGAKVIVWVDNVLVLLPSADQISLVSSALAEAVHGVIREEAIVGLLGRIRPFDVDREAIDYLGFRISRTNGETHFAPAPGYIESAEDHLVGELTANPQLHDARSVTQRIEARLARFDYPAQAHDALLLLSRVLPLVAAGSPEPPDTEDQRSKERTVIDADGACIANPGPGGWGVVIRPAGPKTIASITNPVPPIEFSGGHRMTTNNVMELTAVIEGLRLQPVGAAVLVRSDSRYVVDNVQAQLARWMANGFVRTRGGPVKHRELWRQLAGEMKRLDVRFEWVRGHSGDAMNERADALATAAAAGFAKRNALTLGLPT
jgi:ribonuclease HI